MCGRDDQVLGKVDADLVDDVLDDLGVQEVRNPTHRATHKDDALDAIVERNGFDKKAVVLSRGCAQSFSVWAGGADTQAISRHRDSKWNIQRCDAKARLKWGGCGFSLVWGICCFPHRFVALCVDADMERRTICVDVTSLDAAAFVAGLLLLAICVGFARCGGNAFSVDAILESRTFAGGNTLGALFGGGSVCGGFLVVGGGGAVPQWVEQKTGKQEKKANVPHEAILWRCRSMGFVKNALGYDIVRQEG